MARLQAPDQGIDVYVLEGTSGHALAFGPGLEQASARPGEDGVSVIAGHRDTHFGFLRYLEAGEALELELPNGEQLAYRVATMDVVDSASQQMELDLGLPGELQLVTCYPFDAITTGGSLRYVVRALPTEVYEL